MSTRLYAVENYPFIVRLNVIWDCIAGGCCVFPFVPLVLCSQVSQPAWRAYYSTTLPERPCQFRSSPAKLKDAHLPHFCQHCMSAVYKFDPSLWFCVDLHFFGYWQVAHQSFGFTCLHLSFCRLSAHVFCSFLHSLLACFLKHLIYAVLFLFKSLKLFSPGIPYLFILSVLSIYNRNHYYFT